MKILIGDDHEIIRRGLKQILTEDLTGCRITEASNGNEVIQKINEQPFDIIILDISMPKRNGIDILNQLKIEKPDVPVLILSVHPEEQYAIRMLKAGASGFINKASAPEELVEAIKKILSGGKYISPLVADQLASNMISPGQAPHEMLSDREYQVMLLLAGGKTVREIAEDLTISVKTVSTYRTRCLEKMGLDNNAKLTKYVIQNDLL